MAEAYLPLTLASLASTPRHRSAPRRLGRVLPFGPETCPAQARLVGVAFAAPPGPWEAAGGSEPSRAALTWALRLWVPRRDPHTVAESLGPYGLQGRAQAPGPPGYAPFTTGKLLGGCGGPRFTPHVARGLCPAPLAWPPASRRAPGGPGRGPTGCCHPRRPPTQGCGRESGGPSAGRSRLPAPGARPAASGAGRGVDTAKGGRRWQMSHMRQVVCEA